jgi:hypothetical protein
MSKGMLDAKDCGLRKRKKPVELGGSHRLGFVAESKHNFAEQSGDVNPAFPIRGANRRRVGERGESAPQAGAGHEAGNP